MALFLQESHTPAAKADTTFGLMTALCEFHQEQGNMTEAMLRADFVIHEQTRVLREAADEAGAKAKEDGLATKAWGMVKSGLQKAKELIVRIYNWIKAKLAAFWDKVKSAYGSAKTFVISKAKLAKAKALLLLAKARRKLAEVLVSGAMKVDVAQADVDKAQAAVEAAGKESGDANVAQSEVQGIASEAEGETKGAEGAVPAGGSGNPADAQKAGNAAVGAAQAAQQALVQVMSAKGEAAAS
jgi:hypothetical protein